jgi:Protein of unknown function (DUF2752)
VSTRSRAANLAAWLVVGIGLCGAQLAFSWPCPLYEGLGLDCPLCGATRAVLALSYGRVVEAMDQNLAVPATACLALGALGIVLVRRLAGRGTRWHLPEATFKRAMAIAIAWMVIRNLPMFPVLRSGLS